MHNPFTGALSGSHGNQSSKETSFDTIGVWVQMAAESYRNGLMVSYGFHCSRGYTAHTILPARVLIASLSKEVEGGRDWEMFCEMESLVYCTR